MRSLALLLCLLCSVALGDPPDLGIPAEIVPVQGFARLKPKTEAKAITYLAKSGVYPLPSDFIADPRWFLLDTSRLPVGRYAFTAVGSLNDEHAVVEFVVVVGDAPKPDPKPGPGPQPPAGKRAVLFIWESADSSPAVGSLITNLRAGNAAKYFADKGHTLNLLDDDEVNEDGKPSALLEAWKPHFAGMKLPALFVIDPATKALLHKQEIAPTVTADNIVEIVRQHGG